jgi:hypothetical protein
LEDIPPVHRPNDVHAKGICGIRENLRLHLKRVEGLLAPENLLLEVTDDDVSRILAEHLERESVVRFHDERRYLPFDEGSTPLIRVPRDAVSVDADVASMLPREPMKKLLTEVQAIQDCYDILSKLDDEGRERVMDYLLSILDIEPPSAPPADEDFDGDDEEDEE